MEYWRATIGTPTIQIAAVAIVGGKIRLRRALTLAACRDHTRITFWSQSEDLLVYILLSSHWLLWICSARGLDHIAVVGDNSVLATIMRIYPTILCIRTGYDLLVDIAATCFSCCDDCSLRMPKPSWRTWAFRFLQLRSLSIQRLDHTLWPIGLPTGRVNRVFRAGEVMEYWRATIGTPTIQIAAVAIVGGKIRLRRALTLAACRDHTRITFWSQSEDLLVYILLSSHWLLWICSARGLDHIAVAGDNCILATVMRIHPTILFIRTGKDLFFDITAACFSCCDDCSLCMSEPSWRTWTPPRCSGISCHGWNNERARQTEHRGQSK